MNNSIDIPWQEEPAPSVTSIQRDSGRLLFLLVHISDELLAEPPTSQPRRNDMTQTKPEKPKFTRTQQEAIDKIQALLEIEAETNTVTRRARSSIMQALAPSDLAAIATEIVALKS